MPYGLKWMEDGNVKECSGRRGGGGQAWEGRWVLSSSTLMMRMYARQVGGPRKPLTGFQKGVIVANTGDGVSSEEGGWGYRAEFYLIFPSETVAGL